MRLFRLTPRSIKCQKIHFSLITISDYWYKDQKLSVIYLTTSLELAVNKVVLLG